jgi:hypothetical protein
MNTQLWLQQLEHVAEALRKYLMESRLVDKPSILASIL